MHYIGHSANGSFAECFLQDTRHTIILDIFMICSNHQTLGIFNIYRVSTLGLYGTLGNNQHMTRACAVLTDGVPAVSTSPSVRYRHSAKYVFAECFLLALGEVYGFAECLWRHSANPKLFFPPRPSTIFLLPTYDIWYCMLKVGLFLGVFAIFSEMISF